jgi:CheY-like chemotaxis protein
MPVWPKYYAMEKLQATSFKQQAWNEGIKEPWYSKGKMRHENVFTFRPKPLIMSAGNRYILMVEDDPDDRQITNQTLKEIGFKVPIIYLTQSDKILSFLATHELPAIILIDFNSSPDNGVEILKTLKTNPDYQHIPVIILSESAAPAYVTECYRHGANTFIVKPFTTASTRKKIENFFTYWLEVAEVG